MDIAELLQLSVSQGASDLHLTAGMPPLLRVDGDIRPMDAPALDHATVQSLLDQIMNERQREDFARLLETDFAFAVPGLARFRVNAFTQHRGAAAVFRTIPATVLSMEQLAMGPVFRQIADAARGLVCVTGPTGSGKSTTLAALIDYINNSRYQHILTIEDPIEIRPSEQEVSGQPARSPPRYPWFQRGAALGLCGKTRTSFWSGNCAIWETVRLALTAAETGHLVFATLHTTSAPKTIDRIIDIFPAAEKDMVRAMLSESLQAVISQTLLKKPTGGRVAAHEIMIGTPAIRNLIREHKVAQMYSAMQTGAASGMQTLDQALRDLLSKGLVDREEARSRARGPDSF